MKNMHIPTNPAEVKQLNLYTMIEKYLHREQAEQRTEYLRDGFYQNSYVEERDIVNRWTGKVEHFWVVVKVQ